MPPLLRTWPNLKPYTRFGMVSRHQAGARRTVTTQTKTGSRIVPSGVFTLPLNRLLLVILSIWAPVPARFLCPLSPTFNFFFFLLFNEIANNYPILGALLRQESVISFSLLDHCTICWRLFLSQNNQQGICQIEEVFTPKGHSAPDT